MNDQYTHCGDAMLRDMLRFDGGDDGRRADTLSAEAHIEHCPECQSRLAALAAEPVDWSLVQESLSSGDADGDDECYRGQWMTRRWQHVPSAWTDSMARQLLSPPSHPEMLGRIGRYEVERIMGSGGMGVVFKAFDTELNRPVAVKVLAPYLAGSGAARKRFAREARAAAAIVHEHVVPIHNVETDGELPFLVMHYIAGESLQQRLDREGPLELCEILRIAMQTAAGLAAAHAQGLVHRDVKPSNILLEQGVERTLLTDFGLARASDDASMTRSGYHPGTPQFMSPEQARGESVDQRSDLFSLGSVLYSLCTGRPPFRAETSYGILRRITDTEPRQIREINADIPEWLCAIIARLMTKQPQDRVASAEEVAELLEDCLAHVQQPTVVPLPDCCLSLNEKKVSIVQRVAMQIRRWPLVSRLAVIGLAGLLLCAGILIVLELDKGQLRITSQVDDVAILITQGDEVVEKLTVSRKGKTLRIAAGKYQIELLGDSDAIVVEGSEVSVKRSGVERVRIVRTPTTVETDEDADRSMLPLATRGLATRLRSAQLHRQALLEKYGSPLHPQVLKLDAEIRELTEQLNRVTTDGDSETFTWEDVLKSSLPEVSADFKGDTTILDGLASIDANVGQGVERAYPIGHWPIWTRDGKRQHAGLLIRYLKTRVDPPSWENGRASAVYDVDANSLRVSTTETNHEAFTRALVGDMLGRRKITHPSVSPDNAVSHPIDDLPLWYRNGNAQDWNLLIQYLNSVAGVSGSGDDPRFAWSILKHSLYVKADDETQKKVADALNVLRVEMLLDDMAALERNRDYAGYLDLLTDGAVAQLAQLMSKDGAVPEDPRQFIIDALDEIAASRPPPSDPEPLLNWVVVVDGDHAVATDSTNMRARMELTHINGQWKVSGFNSKAPRKRTNAAEKVPASAGAVPGNENPLQTDSMVSFVGNTHFDSETLRNRVSLPRHGVLSRPQIDKAVDSIVNAYRREGYLEARVSVEHSVTERGFATRFLIDERKRYSFPDIWDLLTVPRPIDNSDVKAVPGDELGRVDYQVVESRLRDYLLRYHAKHGRVLTADELNEELHQVAEKHGQSVEAWCRFLAFYEDVRLQTYKSLEEEIQNVLPGPTPMAVDFWSDDQTQQINALKNQADSVTALQKQLDFATDFPRAAIRSHATPKPSGE